MRTNDIVAHLRKQPFRPLRIYISDGSSYEVRHPEMMMVGRSEITIGLSVKGDPVYDEQVYCDPVHITRIKPLNGARPRRKAKGPRKTR
jgi:hypothetical protein